PHRRGPASRRGGGAVPRVRRTPRRPSRRGRTGDELVARTSAPAERGALTPGPPAGAGMAGVRRAPPTGSRTTRRPPFTTSSAAHVGEGIHQYPRSTEGMAPSRPIGRAAGLMRIGLHLVRVPPGTRTSWPHAESAEEEFAYVIEGEVDAWIDGELHRMKAGDL